MDKAVDLVKQKLKGKSISLYDLQKKMEILQNTLKAVTQARVAMASVNSLEVAAETTGALDNSIRLTSEEIDKMIRRLRSYPKDESDDAKFDKQLKDTNRALNEVSTSEAASG